MDIRVRRTSMAFTARFAAAIRSGPPSSSSSPSASAMPFPFERPEWVENGSSDLRITSAIIVVGIPMSEKATKASKTVTVSERNLQSAALRLLPKHNKLVSPEVDYLRRVLGERATQQQIDEKVLQVRKLPWSEIVHD
ncbi:MAG: hypothetical protein ACRD3J_07610 [Thermoanaerobaculia bacterium]